MPKRRPYQSDLSDVRWELVGPVLAAWRFERRGRALDFGRPPEHDLRDIMDAISYADRTGVQWRYLPHDFLHWNTVYGYCCIKQRWLGMAYARHNPLHEDNGDGSRGIGQDEF